MAFLYIILLLMAAGILYMRLEAMMVKTERIVLGKNKNGLKLVQLSDIHIYFLRVSREKIRSIIERENPDFIIITGDYIDRPKHIPAFLDFIDYVTQGRRTCLCLGNHDYRAFIKDNAGLEGFINLLKIRGIQVLHDDSILFEKNAKKYNIIGLADLKWGNSNIQKALSSCNKNADINVAFSHNPDIVLEIQDKRVDFLLAGHFHGGQIWAPFNLEFKVLREEKLCRMGMKRGLHKVNGIILYINRGLGNVCFPLRFLSRPEVTVFQLP